MKVRVERDVLADAVAWAARTLPSRPSLPLLAGLLIETNDTDGLTLSGFDYETSARVVLNADVAGKGKVLVSGRLLADIARALPAAPVELSLDGSRLAVTCGRSSFVLPTLSVDDYPALPQMPGSSGTITGSAFAEAVAQVAIAAGRDDTLPTLTGVRMEIEGNTITLAATDRYRLAVREVQWSPARPSFESQALVPARVLADTAKSLASAAEVHIALAGDGLIGFEGHGRRTTTRLLDGDFPKYRALLPSESSTLVSIETAALVEAVKRVALVAERNTPVRLAFSGNEVLLRAGAGDEAQATEAAECRIEGDGLEIAFNPQYLLDGLGAVDAPITTMSFTASSRPSVLQGVPDMDTQATGEYRYLLMPVRLAG